MKENNKALLNDETLDEVSGGTTLNAKQKKPRCPNCYVGSTYQVSTTKWHCGDCGHDFTYSNGRYDE